MLNCEAQIPRGLGVVFSVSSANSKYGCGDFGPGMYQLIDWMGKAGMQYLEIRPLGPTGISNSPYQALSSCAGNLNLISLEQLQQQRLLTAQECHSAERPSTNRIDYGDLYENRRLLLHKAFLRFQEQGGFETAEYQDFFNKNRTWAEPYALFMSLKTEFKGEAWLKWPEPYRSRAEDALKQWRAVHRESIALWYFIQYVFFEQWNRLHDYARKRNIRIIGDIPFYISQDSSDVWAEPELFMVDAQGLPMITGGVPGDQSNPAVRNWGMPAYNWKTHEESDFAWWRRRIQIACQMYDGIRLDHAVGFRKWYAIPRDESKASWCDGPDAKGPVVLKMIRDEAAGANAFVIAEDLGRIPDGLREMLDEMGIMGSRIMQFAFSKKYLYESTHLPFYHRRNIALYTGNHDLPTLKEYLESKKPEDTRYMQWWLGPERAELHWNMIREACKSPADIVLIPIQDILETGRESRLVDPKKWENSWQWKLTEEEAVSEKHIQRLRAIAILTGRCALAEEEKNAAFAEALRIEGRKSPCRF